MENVDAHYKKHASRKFIFMMVALIAIVGLVATGNITDVIFRDLLVALGAVYTTGNVWQKHIERSASK